MTFTLEYETNAELVTKIAAILSTFGYRTELANPGRMTVGELSRPSCPPFVCTRGKKRILELEPNDRLLTHLTNPKP